MKKLLFALQGNSTKIFALQGNSTKKIIAGILLVVLMGVLMGCPTEAPKEKKKSGDDGPTPRVPIVIDGDPADWRTENITGGVRIIEYKGTDINIVIPTLVDGTKVLETDGFTPSGGGDFVGIFGQNQTVKNTRITSVDMFNATYLTKINSYTFFFMSSLVRVVLPEGLTTIGPGAFRNAKLPSITIPASVTSIEETAFNSCADLAKVTLSESLETIGENAFGFTALTRIVLPRTLKSIGSGVFYKTLLETVVILRSASLTTTGANIFTDTPIGDATKPSTIYYPTGADYQNAPNWITYKTTTTWTPQ